jgi:hypothetical protein
LKADAWRFGGMPGVFAGLDPANPVFTEISRFKIRRLRLQPLRNYQRRF